MTAQITLRNPIDRMTIIQKDVQRNSYLKDLSCRIFESLGKVNEFKEISVNFLDKNKYELLPYGIVFLFVKNYPIAVLTGFSTSFFSSVCGIIFTSKIIEKLFTEEEIKNCSIVKQIIEIPTFYKIFIAPIFEEIFFRGCIQNGLSYILGKNIGILSSAFLFGGIHLLGAKDRVSFILLFLQSVNATILGLPLGIINNIYGLRTSIAAHMVHNTLLPCAVHMRDFISKKLRSFF